MNEKQKKLVGKFAAELAQSEYDSNRELECSLIELTEMYRRDLTRLVDAVLDEAFKEPVAWEISYHYEATGDDPCPRSTVILTDDWSRADYAINFENGAVVTPLYRDPREGEGR